MPKQTYAVRVALINVFNAEIQANSEEEAVKIAQSLIIQNGELQNRPSSVVDFDFSHDDYRVDGGGDATSIF